MDVAYISAFSALAGSIVGGLISGFTTWLGQRYQARAGLIVHELSHREDLYRDFIAAASKTYGEANMRSEPQAQELVSLYGMVSRMRVQSSPHTIVCAEAVVRATMDAYLAPNKTPADLYAAMQSGEETMDPLKEFAEAARQEIGQPTLPHRSTPARKRPSIPFETWDSGPVFFRPGSLGCFQSKCKELKMFYVLSTLHFKKNFPALILIYFNLVAIPSIYLVTRQRGHLECLNHPVRSF